MIYEDLLEFFLAWCRTRKWRRLLLAAAVLALLPLMVAGLVVYGAMLSRPDIYGRYLSLVQDDINESIDAASRSEEVDLDSSARVLQVPLRRILQLGNSNERVAFVVANSLAAQGRVGMAVQMMREIAPAGDSGFAPAHAWMANHELSLGVKTPAQAEKILHDLEIADSSGVTLSANQVMVFVNLLIANRREQEALKVLRTRAKIYPQLNDAYAELANKLEQSSDYNVAASAVRADVELNQKNGERNLTDVLRLVRLELFDKNYDKALAIVEAVRRNSPDDVQLRRIHSNILLEKRNEIIKNSSDQQVELGLLDAALKADPTNSVAVEQLAIAAYKGQQLAPESMELLEKSLVDGNASGVTHLIMANRKLIADELEAAIGHLRLALNQMPGNPIVLNNLAFALFKLHPEKVDEAAELIDQALKAPSTSPQQTANMLDTQGQVRLGQNDKLGAIGSFEQAIKLDTNKLDTRRRLAEVYRQMGMADLADAQLKRIEELEK